MKRVVLISSGQPSFNPRLAKEASALVAAGYEVFIVYSFWNSLAATLDIELFKRVKWHPLLAGGQPGNVQYLYTRIRHKAYTWLAKNITYSLGIAEIAKGRAFSELLIKARSIKADLYIAHNLAALPIAVKAAKYNNAKSGFDAEDFHRQEVNDDVGSSEYKLAKFIEDKYLPLTNYRTAASPLIAKVYKTSYPALDFTVINNVFSKSYQPKELIVNKTGSLKLFWFSQTIGKNRGLEQVWQALGKVSDLDIELTLVGNCSQETQAYLDALIAEHRISKEKIKMILPLPEQELFELAAQHDVGLALEPGFCYNNKVALSNKIFSYLISGLAIIATNTQAQQQFINQYPTIGKSFNIGDIYTLEQILRQYYNNREALNAARLAAYNLAKNELNWEKESEQFLEIVKKQLN